MGAARRLWAICAVLTLAAAVAAPALSHPGAGDDPRDKRSRLSVSYERARVAGPAGAPGRRRTIRAENFELLGHLRLATKSPNADIFFYDHGGDVGKHIYIGTWGIPCSGGAVKIIDVNDPTSPRLVDVAGRRKGISNEDMVVRRIGGRDILALGVQQCGPEGRGGLRLIDVTDPARARKVGFIGTPSTGVHELDVAVRGDGTALALAAVPFAELEEIRKDKPSGGDFRIIDITDPARPVAVTDWGVVADSALRIPAGVGEFTSPFQGLGYYPAAYAHSVRAADGGETAFVSYWDAGVLKFDISEPDRPRLVAHTTFDAGDDGDAHSMALYRDRGRRYILQADEDFFPVTPPLVTSSATGEREFAGVELSWMPTILSETDGFAGEVLDARRGCSAAAFDGARGKVVLFNARDPSYIGEIPGWEVPCGIGRQVVLAARAGADAIVVNLVSPDDAYSFGPPVEQRDELDVARGIPAVAVSDIDGLADALRATPAGATVTVTPGEPSHGFLRVYREDDGDDVDGDGVVDLAEVGRFTGLPHVVGDLEPPPGTWAVHNPEVNGSRAYLAWYSHGIVAVALDDPPEPARLGRFVPPAGGRFEQQLGAPAAQMWGVVIDPETDIVYGSDMRTGLWIVRPTGPAAP